MTQPRLAVDFSNYTPVPTQEQVRCLLAHGYSVAIIGVSFGSVGHAQLEACARGGMDIEAYAWVRFDDGWRGALDKALNAIGGLPVRRLWLDCEEHTAWAPDAVLGQIAWAEVYVRNQRPDLEIGIYTGGWWWADVTRNSTRFNTLPLWSAYYDNEPDIDFATLPYGGWKAPAIEQYAGSVETCGLNTDRNVIAEEHMASIEYDELHQRDEDIKRALAIIAARHKAAIDFLSLTAVNLAGQVYGDDDPKTLDLKQRVDALAAALAGE